MTYCLNHTWGIVETRAVISFEESKKILADSLKNYNGIPSEKPQIITEAYRPVLESRFPWLTRIPNYVMLKSIAGTLHLPCHRDFHPGNILVNERNVCKLIDYEWYGVDSPVIDVARFCFNPILNESFENRCVLTKEFCEIITEKTQYDVDFSTLHTAHFFGRYVVLDTITKPSRWGCWESQVLPNCKWTHDFRATSHGKVQEMKAVDKCRFRPPQFGKLGYGKSPTAVTWIAFIAAQFRSNAAFWIEFWKMQTHYWWISDVGVKEIYFLVENPFFEKIS